MNENAYQQRAIDDIIASEHELRRNAENVSREMQAILSDLAFRLDGERLESRRHDDPYAPSSWTPVEWKQFFEKVERPRNAWVEVVPDKRLQQLEEENAGLRELISQMKVDLARLKKGEGFLRNMEKKKPEPVSYKYTHALPAVPRAYEDIAAALREMPLLKKPPRFAEALGEAETLYKRQLMMLYMLATKGVNARVELDLILGIVEGIGPSSSTIRRVVEKTEKGSLIKSMTRFIDKPLHTGLTLVWLTPTGKEFCREMGWEVLESEWERLIRLRGEGEGEKNLVIIIFVMHARLRGYIAQVLPEVEGRVVADIALVNKTGLTIYMSMETGEAASMDRMWDLLAIQGKVYFCAIDPEVRVKVETQCQEHGYVQGISTDLRTLILGNVEREKPMPLADISEKNPMWTGEW